MIIAIVNVAKKGKDTMNIKLNKIISLFNERKNFFNNHPDLYRFMCDNVAQGLPLGTEIEVKIKRESGKAESVKFEVQEVDKKFVDSFADILKK